METFKKYLTHPKIWIYALLGKSMPVEIPEHQVTYQAQGQVQAGNPAQPVKPINPDDPLHQDLEKASSLLKKVTSKLSTVSAPLVASGNAISNQAVTNTSTFVKTDRFKKIVPILIFGVVILALLIAGAYFVIPFISKLGKKVETPIVITNPTPTPIELEPIIPSIYSTDPEILQLEEDINVLDREVVGAQLRESTLNPPVLDFNVTF